ncbi:MAG: hypothetical protein ACLQMH_10835 [Solirubrobacteraceae bacterium]
MRSRYDRCRRIAGVAACLGSTAAIAMLANAGTAMASVECVTSPVYGSGSSFQNTAQEKFKANWPGSTNCKAGVPTSTYTATSSGEGLEVFGFGNAAGENKEVLQPGKDTTAKKAEESKTCVALDEEKNCLDLFVGSDDAPSTEQLKYATTASGGLSNSLAGEKGHRATVVIPVAQGPVAAILSLPAGLKVEKNSRIDLTNEAFQQLWGGKSAIKAQGGYAEGTWCALLTQLGYKEGPEEADPTFRQVPEEETLARFYAPEESYKVHTKAQIEKNEPEETVKLPTRFEKIKSEGCSAPIKAQVRSSESGTSYAAKSYFNQIEPAVWKSLATDAATWPEEGGVVRENLSTSGNETIKNKKGSQLAENAAATPGSVGYADTADAAKGGGSTSRATESQRSSPSSATLLEVVANGEAENLTTHAKEKVFEVKSEPVKSISHQILYADVQNNGVKPTGEKGEGAKFALPLVEGGAIANEANCETAKLVGGDTSFPKHWNESWRGVLTSDPDAATVSSEVYPACAITFDIAWHHYRNVKLYGNVAHTPNKLANEMAATAKDYFEFMNGAGATDLKEGGYYVGPPTAMSKYIKAAIAQIGP